MTTNQEFKNAALRALKGNWAKAVLATIVVEIISALVTGAASISETPIVEGNGAWGVTGGSFLLSVLVLMPLAVGFGNTFKVLYLYSDKNIFSNAFYIGFRNYGRAIGGMILTNIFIVLWSMLFVIPGIIKAYSYALTPYILVDDPNISIREAIRKSQNMMDGQKFNLFYLQLSFIGWFLLSILTMGIGLFWLTPYYATAKAAFYCNLRNDLQPVETGFAAIE